MCEVSRERRRRGREEDRWNWAPAWCLSTITCLGGLKVAVHSIGLWLWLRQVLHCRKCRRCSELLTRTIGRLGGSIVRWGLSSPIGAAGAALELPMLRGPCESSC